MNTKDAFDRIKKVWPGAEWSKFCRYWLGAGRREFYYKLAGYRKPALLGIAGTKRPTFSTVPTKILDESDEIDLSGSPEIDQGRIGACGCATLCAIVQDEAVRQTRDKSISIDWKRAWSHMKELGIAGDDTGSYLNDNLWFAQEHGYYDTKGRLWKVDKVQKIGRLEIEKYIRMHYQVYTGSFITAPMCDKNWVFRIGSDRGGHCYRKKGITHKYFNRKQFLNETTWHDYGLKRESEFLFELSDVGTLMSRYVVTVKKA